MMNHARVYKKTAPNGKITIYIERRELLIHERGIEPVHGVLYVDASYVKDRKVFAQFVLTFRYGRQDEEVMGLRFCNEACLQACQLWPPLVEEDDNKSLTPLQETLIKRLGSGAVAFSLSVNSLSPPSVTLLPARNYTGAPIGTNYDMRIFVGENVAEKPHKRSSIKMGMKLFQIESLSSFLQPYASFSKQLLLTEGQVSIEVCLNKETYQGDEPVCVNVTLNNSSSRKLKRIKVFIVQFVDVAMFSNGKFKNVVASLDTTEGFPILPGSCKSLSYKLIPLRGSIKNWIAVEEHYDRQSTLASSVIKTSNGEGNVFAIYVSYYVKVKILTSGIAGEVSVKVPFKLIKLHPLQCQENLNDPNTPLRNKRLPKYQGLPLTCSQSMFDLSDLKCLSNFRRHDFRSGKCNLIARSKSADYIESKFPSQLTFLEEISARVSSPCSSKPSCPLSTKSFQEHLDITHLK